MNHRRDWSVSSKANGWDMTITYKSGGLRRVLTVDTRAVPHNDYEAQQWFLILLGRIWWDISATDSFAITTHVADAMVAALNRQRHALEGIAS